MWIIGQIYLKQFSGIWSVFGILCQGQCNKVLELFRPSVRIGESRRGSGRNHKNNAHGVYVVIWRLSFSHLDTRYSQRPDIRLNAISKCQPTFLPSCHISPV